MAAITVCAIPRDGAMYGREECIQERQKRFQDFKRENAETTAQRIHSELPNLPKDRNQRAEHFEKIWEIELASIAKNRGIIASSEGTSEALKFGSSRIANYKKENPCQITRLIRREYERARRNFSAALNCHIRTMVKANKQTISILKSYLEVTEQVDGQTFRFDIEIVSKFPSENRNNNRPIAKIFNCCFDAHGKLRNFTEFFGQYERQSEGKCSKDLLKEYQSIFSSSHSSKTSGYETIKNFKQKHPDFYQAWIMYHVIDQAETYLGPYIQETTLAGEPLNMGERKHQIYQCTTPQADQSAKHIFLDLARLRRHYVVITQRVQISNQFVALSKYITWLPSSEALNYSPKFATVINEVNMVAPVAILHQDVFLANNFTLPECKRIFGEILENIASANPNQERFKEQIAKLLYFGAHAMPWARGSAAIFEVLTEALAECMGLEFVVKETSVDLLALTNINYQAYKMAFDEQIIFRPKPLN